MDKASKVFRRGGVRLRTLSSRHSELQLLISELRTVRAAQRGLVAAQNRAAQDLVRWSLRDENRAVQEVAQLLAELTAIYADVQTEFNVTERTRENEVAKMARLKQGLLTLSDAYLQLAERTQLVFSAHRDIVSELPDIDAEHLHAAKFTGSQRCQQRVGRVRELLRPPESGAAAAVGRADSVPPEPPPPYAAGTPTRRQSAAPAPAGTPPCRCGAAQGYGWRNSSMSSASDFSPSAPLDSSASPVYPDSSPGYPSGPAYPDGSPGYPGDSPGYTGAGHGAAPRGHPPVPVPRWLPHGHGGHDPQPGLAAAVGGLQLR
ncbi:protein diaphanous homolog 1-like isoform X2 [Amphibalanus amphitrite]|uniref:protein diaphanous homolog 1-like isoform X2 n=1 Tax=Amphibalanus amphitrite TaxID=1232801 RepID=UPI001C90815F|nr:protein diaphanous homolog 1-like isoform X2 [Amphibalanus amphitrite]XP_043216730.1 protein diaphanous homolog 1-like isoform X2 [Amphibalanus amphitrite]XP_043216731.1 protein diaphanous homolog 1-like isoform X2 [Amphibalanus amphitrite]